MAGFGHSFAPSVIHTFLAFRAGRKPETRRFSVWASYSKADASGSSLARAESLSELEGMEFDYAQVFDLYRLAKNIPAEIRGLLIAAAETEADDYSPSLDGLTD